MASLIDLLVAELEQKLAVERWRIALYKSFLSPKDWSQNMLSVTNDMFKYLERLHGISVLQAAPGTTLLYDVEVFGFEKIVNGKVVRVPIEDIPRLRKRIFDCFQLAAKKGMGIELKTGSALINSVRGGLSSDELKTVFLRRSAIRKQLTKETTILNYARRNGYQVVLIGRDVVTNAPREVLLEADNIAKTRVTTYRALPDVLLKPAAGHVAEAAGLETAGAIKPSTPNGVGKAGQTATGTLEKKGADAAGGIADNGVKQGVTGQPAAAGVAGKEAEKLGEKGAVATAAPAVATAETKKLVARRSLLSRIKFSPKLKAFLSNLLEDALLIAFDLFVEYLKNKEYQGVLKKLDDEVKVEVDRLMMMDSTIAELEKFRIKEDQSDGYQLYFMIRFLLHRPGTISFRPEKTTMYMTGYAEILSVGLVHQKGNEIIPEYVIEDEDDKWYAGGQPVKSTGQFFMPIYESGIKVTPASEDAIASKFTAIESLNTPNAKSWTYLKDFHQYVKFFPSSSAAYKWYSLIATEKFEKLLVGVGIYDYFDLTFLKNYRFDTIMKMIHWFGDADIKFVASYQKFLEGLSPELRMLYYPIEKKYLDRLKKTRMCDYRHHQTTNPGRPVAAPRIVPVVAKPEPALPPKRKKFPVLTEQRACTTDCHAPNDRGVPDPLTEMRKRAAGQ